MKRAYSCAVALAALCVANRAVAADEQTETPVRVDAAASMLIRSNDERGSVYLFSDSPRYSVTLRGAIWWPLGQYQRLGVWLGYRYEPGPAWVTFTRAPNASLNDPGSAGVKSWMLAHDLSIGPTYDVSICTSCWMLAFARAHAGIGLTSATLQIQSRDDGHIYSDTDLGWNLSGTLELGARLRKVGLELFAGGGYLWSEAPNMVLKQDGVTFESKQTSLVEVPRAGVLAYVGLGLEL